MPLSNHDLVTIEQKAFNLINQCNIVAPPIDINLIAMHLGLKVLSYDLNEVSGALIIENNKALIGYNPNQSDVRKRFTIAHEIGHFCLHTNLNEASIRKDQLFVDKDFLIKYRNANNYSFVELRQEQQANAFAAALLMPVTFLQRSLNRPVNKKLEEIELINKLAKDFNVSIPAMTFRLDNLNTYLYK